MNQKNDPTQQPEVVDLTQDDVIRLGDKECPYVVVSDGDEDDDNDIITLDDSLTPEPARLQQKPFQRRSSKPRFCQPPPQPPDSPPNALKCPICLETYVNIKQSGHKTVVTRCGHMFCDNCLKKAISDNGRKCPKCRKAIPKGVTGIIEIFDVC